MGDPVGWATGDNVRKYMSALRRSSSVIRAYAPHGMGVKVTISPWRKRDTN